MAFSHLYFVLSAFLLALGSVLAKHILSAGQMDGPSIDPVPFLSLQLAGGVMFLGAVLALAGRPLARRRHLMRPMIAGLVVGVGAFGTIMALALISASEAAVIFATQPVGILILARLVLREPFRPALAALCLIAVFGTIVIVIGGGVDGSGSRTAGIAFAVLSTACAAVYVVVMRDLARQIDAAAALIVVLSVAFVLAGLVWALIAATALVPTSVGTLRLALYSIATGAIYYGAAFYAYIIGLERTPASTAGVYLTLIPVFVIALAWLFLSERLAHVQWLGAGMVVLAVGAMSALSLRHPRPTAL